MVDTTIFTVLNITYYTISLAQVLFDRVGHHLSVDNNYYSNQQLMNQSCLHQMFLCTSHVLRSV